MFWERELDDRVLGQSTWETIGQRDFDDDPRVFPSYLHTLQCSCVTATDPGLFLARCGRASMCVSLQVGATAHDHHRHFQVRGFQGEELSAAGSRPTKTPPS